MIRNNRIVKLLAFIVISSAFCSATFLCSNDVLALAGNDSDFTKIALLTGLRQCYEKGDDYVKSDGIQLNKFKEVSYWGGIGAIFGNKGKNDKVIVVPSGVGNSLKAPYKITCSDVVYGRSSGGNIAGLKDIYSISSVNPEFYGYVVDDEKNEGENLETLQNYQVKISMDVDISRLGLSKTINRIGELLCNVARQPVGSTYFWDTNGCEGTLRFEESGVSDHYLEFVGIGLDYPDQMLGSMSKGNQDVLMANISTYGNDINGYTPMNGDGGKNLDGTDYDASSYENMATQWKPMDVSLEDSFKTPVIRAFSYLGDLIPEDITFNISNAGGENASNGAETDNFYKFIQGGGKEASKIAVYNITGGKEARYIITSSSKKSFAGWTAPYQYHLYYKYLEKIMNKDEYKGYVTFGLCSKNIPNYKWYMKVSEDTWCSIDIAGSVEDKVLKEKVSLINSDLSSMSYDDNSTFEKVLEWFKNKNNYGVITNKEDYLNPSVDENGEITSIPKTDSGETTGPTEDGASAGCMSGGGGSLSWIICPILTLMEGATEGLYNDYVEPALQIDSKLFSGEEDATRKGWEVFRGLGNVLVIILFLIVIFSQLTGYGIDNYGIKKILPKIIVGAILMNLSYWICTALVDLSNILGNSLQVMFEGFGDLLPGLPEGVSDGTGAMIAVGIVEGLVTTGIVGVVIWQNPALLLSLLISVLGALIAIFFLFVLLSVREAAIVILTVLSSIAVVCFMLPNTKKIFDKWWKLFYSLLMVYPIVGLLVGGGNYVSKLLLTGGAVGADKDFFRVFTAMLVGIAPIFFIPTVLKGSLNAMGQLGAKISGVGQSFKNGTVGRFAKSDTRKRWATSMNNVDLGGYRDKFANTGFGKRFGLRNNRARQIAAAKRQQTENREAGALLTGSINDRYEKKHGAMSDGQMQAEIDKAVASGHEEEFYALMDDAGKRFGASKQAEMLHDAIEKNYGVGLMSDSKKTKFFRDTAARYAGLQAKDYATLKYLRQGGVGKDATGHDVAMDLTNFNDIASNINDLKDEEAATLNGGSLNRMGDNISQEMAQRVMANKELRRGMDQAIQLMWANRAEGGATITKAQAEQELMQRAQYSATHGGSTSGYVSGIGISQAAFDRLAPLPDPVTVNNTVDVNLRDVDIRGNGQTDSLQVHVDNQPTQQPPQPPTPPPVNNPNSTDSRLF